MTPSFYWHDYETFGIDPQKDRACQFAGIRTDNELNIIDDPQVFFCRLPDDCLPSPEACLITGLTPQKVAHGDNEAIFTRKILAQLSQPGTCAVGYNSIRFDDEVTRHLLYRNLYDPYAREWQNQNSRWDLIDVVRACHALRPEGINWPLNSDGVVSMKLEALTTANAISHEQAHDALSDVYATIAIAKLIRNLQPRFYEYCLGLRRKQRVEDVLALGQFKPIVHVSGRYANKRNNIAIVLPLARHPHNEKEIIVYDLSVAPDPFLALSVDELKQRLFMASEDVTDTNPRLPLKTLHTNKSPFIAPLSVLRPSDTERLRIDIPSLHQHQSRLLGTSELIDRLISLYSAKNSPIQLDPELMLYSGGFFSQHDRQTMQSIHRCPDHMLNTLSPIFEDPRLDTLWFRYKARNYPEALNIEERQHWQDFCQQRLFDGDPSAWQLFWSSLERLKNHHPDNLVLQELEAFATHLAQSS